jgi:hypothetical protein
MLPAMNSAAAAARRVGPRISAFFCHSERPIARRSASDPDAPLGLGKTSDATGIKGLPEHENALFVVGHHG